MNRECEQLFFYALEFRSGDFGESLGEGYGDEVRSQFARLMAQADENITYAIAAFMDESILTSRWPYRNSWQVNTLQQCYFHEQLAGEGFFTRLAKLRQNSKVNIDLIEIFYLCLQFGFRGVYLAKQEESLLVLQNELWLVISSIRSVKNDLLTSDKTDESKIMRIGRLVPLWIVVAVSGSIMLAVYLSFDLTIDHQTKKVVDKINYYAASNL